MENKTSRKNTRSLTQKLRNVLSNIQVDVWGYEKTVTKNIHSYFHRLSGETGIPKDGIIVRIFRDYGQIRVCVHKQGKRIKEIPVSELILLLTNTHPSALPQLQEKVVTGIQKFMMDYCATHLIHPDNLHICILTSGEKVFVKGVNRTDEIGLIPLMVLIKHFTR